MKHPAMSKQQHLSVKVPALDGGVNYTDMPYDVQDNQLTECKNMWWHKGALRTRPGMKPRVFEIRTLTDGKTSVRRTFNHNGSQQLSEQETALTYIGKNSEGKTVFYADSFQGDREDTWEILGVKKLEVDAYTTALLARKGEKYYTYLSDGRTLETSGYFEYWSAAEPYAPLVMMDGKGSEDTSGEPATTYEGHNRLTGAFRCQYSTDGKSSTFYLPQGALTHNKGETVEITIQLQHQKDTADGVNMVERVVISEADTKNVTITESDGSLTLAKKIDPDLLGVKYDDVGNEDVTECLLKCTLFKQTGVLSFSATVTRPNGEYKTDYIDPKFPKPAGMETNNLEIKVWKTDADAQAVIGKMTQSTWFGGDRSGVNGGTRLFVAGNPDEPNLVCWSDLNNPLYFPENNFAYVGDANQAVTGFGKQGDALIIFKEHEIYSAQYVAGNVTRADDITTQTAQFPITPVHSTIGCDCPNTIRLVNNQLVWLSSNGHVYTLPTVNQYDENNVRDISLLIQDVLQKHTKEELKKAVAGEYMGYYLLAVGNRIYMMNAECGAFASVHYYSSKERAQRAIPWYVWDVPGDEKRILGMVVDGDTLCIAREEDWSIIKLGGIDDDGNLVTTDNGEPIPCSFTTKAFNFGQLDKRKAVNQLYLSATAQSPLKMRLSYITDRFTAEDAAILEGDGDPEDMTAENYKVYRVTPNVHRVGLFGLRVDCDGAMAVNGLTIKYKNEGVIR